MTNGKKKDGDEKKADEKEKDAAETKADGQKAEQAPPSGQPSEEELRAQLEEEIRKVRVEDVLLQSVASILNLSARRIAKEDERDLGQAKVGIDAARAVVDLLPEEPRKQVEQAISELQLLYARESEGGKAGEAGGGREGEGGEPKKPDGEKPKGDSGLWTPGS